MKKNIFVIALDPFTHSFFETINPADGYRYHSLISTAEIITARSYSVSSLLSNACRKMKRFSGSIDAIVSYWDFPCTLLLPLLRQAASLTTTSLESMLKCEHKIWSRAIQNEVVPQVVPRICACNPFAENPLETIDIPFPFWLKPVKAHSSMLGFQINNLDDFQYAVAKIRAEIDRIAEPFNYICRQADIPPDIAVFDGRYCLAEELIDAENQCTLEGYVFNGQPVVYGIIDSLREVNETSFSRYCYPSRLPRHIQGRMIELTHQLMQFTGLNNEPFNIEFFHDPNNDRISLLEINPRISRSHCPLFALVHGASHQEVMVQVALGIEPDYPRGAGRYPLAAKYMIRHYGRDARVERIPSPEDIAQLYSQVDGVYTSILVREGGKLSDYSRTDSYSYEYANLFIGALNESDLENKYRRCLDLLPFEFKPMEN